MKDLKELWDKGSGDSKLPEFNQNDLLFMRERTDSPINKLKRNIQINSGFGIFFTLVFGYLFFTIDGFWFRIFMGALVLAYLAGVWFNNRIIKTYLKEIPKDESLKSYLERLTKGMRRAFRAVEITAIFIYPIAMTAGFLIPMTLENKLDQFSKGPFLWVLLFSLFVIITPLCFWLTRVLNKLAFGKYIDEIQKVLQQIEENQAF
jgi:hypothetical protein